jgi:hypothetical protein
MIICDDLPLALEIQRLSENFLHVAHRMAASQKRNGPVQSMAKVEAVHAKSRRVRATKSGTHRASYMAPTHSAACTQARHTAHDHCTVHRPSNVGRRTPPHRGSIANNSTIDSLNQLARTS